jgi:hypothetical protein
MTVRLMDLLFLSPALLMLGGAAPAGADSTRKVTGEIQWSFEGGYAWFAFDVREVVPGEAQGSVSLKEYDEELGWRRWKGHPICVAFAEGFDGEPAAAFVVQIDRITGWGPGGAGQYVKLWLSDGGTPPAAGDLAGLVVYPPRDKQPKCDYKRPKVYWPLDGGDVAIHN